MLDKLRDNLKNSYSPYSNFAVSAIVVTSDGREFSGVNIENASYGATVCAERCAIFKAASEGIRPGQITELHLLVGSGKIGTPCFMCRQVISEFMRPDAIVVCYSTEGDKQVFNVSELCPAPFGADDLK